VNQKLDQEGYTFAQGLFPMPISYLSLTIGIGIPEYYVVVIIQTYTFIQFCHSPFNILGIVVDVGLYVVHQVDITS